MGRSRRISHWDPEDDAAWEAGNNVIARRNLIWSIATMHVAFSIWYLWSVMVLFMPQSVYGFSTGDKLLVGATAALVGALVRIPYAMATARLGGRNWAVVAVSTHDDLTRAPGAPVSIYTTAGYIGGFIALFISVASARDRCSSSSPRSSPSAAAHWTSTTPSAATGNASDRRR